MSTFPVQTPKFKFISVFELNSFSPTQTSILPILTNFMPSSSMALSATEAFSKYWCWLAGRRFHPFGKKHTEIMNVIGRDKTEMTSIQINLPLSGRFCRFSTSVHKCVPSQKSVVQSDTYTNIRMDQYHWLRVKWQKFTCISESLRCSFTQLRNVFAWISTHRSSLPRMFMPLAAVPSGLRATRPAWVIFCSSVVPSALCWSNPVWVTRASLISRISIVLFLISSYTSNIPNSACLLSFGLLLHRIVFQYESSLFFSSRLYNSFFYLLGVYSICEWKMQWKT